MLSLRKRSHILCRDLKKTVKMLKNIFFCYFYSKHISCVHARTASCTYNLCFGVDVRKMLTCTYNLCFGVNVRKMLTCTYNLCFGVNIRKMLTCNYNLCFGVNVRKMLTCTYNLCFGVNVKKMYILVNPSITI